MNSLTRPIPSSLQIFVQLSSLTSNLALLRNVISPTLYVKEWMTNGIVLLPFPSQVILQILSLFKTWAVMNLWMLPKFQTVFEWIQTKAPRILPKTPSVLNLTVTTCASCLQWLTGAIPPPVFSPQYDLIRILPRLWAIFLQLICFSNGTDKSNSPSSDTTMGNDLSFPSVINNISSIGNANHRPSSKSNPSDSLDIAATKIAVTNQKDDAV